VLNRAFIHTRPWTGTKQRAHKHKLLTACALPCHSQMCYSDIRLISRCNKNYSMLGVPKTHRAHQASLHLIARNLSQGCLRGSENWPINMQRIRSMAALDQQNVPSGSIAAQMMGAPTSPASRSPGRAGADAGPQLLWGRRTVTSWEAGPNSTGSKQQGSSTCSTM